MKKKMKFSYEKIGAWSTTFPTETAVEDRVVKMSAAHTVADMFRQRCILRCGRRGAQRYLRCADERYGGVCCQRQRTCCR